MDKHEEKMAPENPYWAWPDMESEAMKDHKEILDAAKPLIELLKLKYSPHYVVLVTEHAVDLLPVQLHSPTNDRGLPFMRVFNIALAEE